MVSFTHTEKITLGIGLVVKFEYDCTVDLSNEHFPVTAKMTSGMVYHNNKKIGKWENLERFWGKTKNHDWAGFEARVIATSNQLKQAA